MPVVPNACASILRSLNLQGDEHEPNEIAQVSDATTPSRPWNSPAFQPLPAARNAIQVMSCPNNTAAHLSGVIWGHEIVYQSISLSASTGRLGTKSGEIFRTLFELHPHLRVHGARRNEIEPPLPPHIISSILTNRGEFSRTQQRVLKESVYTNHTAEWIRELYREQPQSDAGVPAFERCLRWGSFLTSPCNNRVTFSKG